jgi:hypothetical protein
MIVNLTLLPSYKFSNPAHEKTTSSVIVGLGSGVFVALGGTDVSVAVGGTGVSVSVGGNGVNVSVGGNGVNVSVGGCVSVAGSAVGVLVNSGVPALQLEQINARSENNVNIVIVFMVMFPTYAKKRGIDVILYHQIILLELV